MVMYSGPYNINLPMTTLQTFESFHQRNTTQFPTRYQFVALLLYRTEREKREKKKQEEEKKRGGEKCEEVEEEVEMDKKHKQQHNYQHTAAGTLRKGRAELIFKNNNKKNDQLIILFPLRQFLLSMLVFSAFYNALHKCPFFPFLNDSSHCYCPFFPMSFTYDLSLLP